MTAYRVSVTDAKGDLVVGATLHCADDAAARAKFADLPLPPGRAELRLGDRLVAERLVDTRLTGS